MSRLYVDDTVVEVEEIGFTPYAPTEADSAVALEIYPNNHQVKLLCEDGEATSYISLHDIDKMILALQKAKELWA